LRRPRNLFVHTSRAGVGEPDRAALVDANAGLLSGRGDAESATPPWPIS
jgi:hypothetical protein